MDDFSEFKDKKVWAVVGSVHNKDKFAYKIYKFLLDKGYTVYPVDPSGSEVDGERSYRSLKELPEVPAALDMVINPVKGRQYIEEANQLNIKYVWFQPGAECSEIIEKAESYDMEVVHNSCVMVEF